MAALWPYAAIKLTGGGSGSSYVSTFMAYKWLCRLHQVKAYACTPPLVPGLGHVALWCHPSSDGLGLHLQRVIPQWCHHAWWHHTIYKLVNILILLLHYHYNQKYHSSTTFKSRDLCSQFFFFYCFSESKPGLWQGTFINVFMAVFSVNCAKKLGKSWKSGHAQYRVGLAPKFIKLKARK